MVKNHYVVLGITRDANMEGIKRAYRKEAKKYHPDITRSRETEQRFVEITEAYDTLSDETRRRTYDRELARQDLGVRISGTSRGRAYGRRRTEGLEALFSELDQLLGGFRARPRRFETPGKTRDAYMEITLTKSEALYGGIFPLSIPVSEPCPRCRPRGWGFDSFCPLCSGSGSIRREQRYSLRIPPRIKHGTQMTLSLGDADRGGDYLTIRFLVDPRW